jgi:ribosomal protein S6--L-glutamate ligase
MLEANDRLLCFGRLEEMRDMIPDRRRRSRVRPLPIDPESGRPVDDEIEV